MVFFLLIVMVVFASFIVILNQNTGLEQTTVQAKQLDLDRYTELATVSVSNPEIAVLNQNVYISCSITNNGTLPAQLVRLWIRDITQDTVGNMIITPSIIIQPGTYIQYFNSSYVVNASSSDQFAFWFISTRGNTISAFPETNQFNGLVQDGNFPGVNAVNSTYATTSTPLQLSLTTTKPNQLIYVVVSYDDENYLTPLNSNPVLTWINRINSSDTDSEWGMNGDSTLGTYYAIKPSPGPITIYIKSTTDEISDYYCSALAFAISDVNTTSPFDKGAPQTDIGKSAMPQDKITTYNSNEFIIGALCIDSLNPDITPGTDFAEIMPVQSSYGATGEPDALPRSVWSEWAIMQNPRTNLSVNCTFTSTKNWAIIVDAVKLVVVTPSTPVSLSPSSGPVGQPVTVSGQGLAANSPLLAVFDGSQVPFSATTDSNGTIPPNAIFTVPMGVTPSNKTVTIIDKNFNYVNTTFLVTTPNITISPTNGQVGTTVTVTGSNFIDNSTININFAGNPTATNPSPIVADSTGSFSATFIFNFNDSAGINPVMASDGINSAFANFNVIPSITLNPTSGPIGSLVTVYGTGFAASQSLIITFAGATVVTNPITINTDGFGFFSAIFTIPTGQIAGAKNVVVTDANSNSATSQFAVTPSIALNPTSGNVGSTVTLSGSGFAANSAIALKFAGSTVTLGGTTSTNSSGAFTGATFTVPTWVSTWAIGSVQTVTISDAASNLGSNTYTVNTVTQSVTVAMSNSAPSATVTVNGGNPNPNTFGADGVSHSIIMFAGSPFNLSFSNSGNVRNGFIVASAFSASSISYTASVTPVTVAGFEQVQNTFSVTYNGGNAGSGDSLTLKGTYLGTAAYTIGTLNSVNGWSLSLWSDYNTAVTFPANTALSSSSQRWAINGAYSTAALTAGNNPYTQIYYNQYSFQLDYAVSGSGSPTAPTLTTTQFNSVYTPTLGNSLVTFWFDNAHSWSATNPLGGSGSSERWASRQTVSGTISVSSPTTAGTGLLTFTYYHQYLLTVNGGNGVTFGTASPTGDNWYDNGVSTTVSSNGIYNRVSGTGQRVSSWQIDSGTVSNIAATGSVSTSSVSMSTAHSVTFSSITQYLLTVNGGNGVTFGTASPTGDNWYDNGMSTTVSSNWAWGTSGSTRTSLSNWQLDGTNQNPPRQNTGTLTTSSIPMSATHTVNFVSTTQYYLTVTGGSSLTFGTASPTSDQWYDSGTSTTISSNWVWNTVSGQSRTAIVNYAIDGTNRNPARLNTGTLTTSSVSMTTSHTVSFSSVTQYYLTVSGGNGITYGTVSPTSDSWYDSGGSTTVSSNGVWSRSAGSGQRVASWNVDGGSNTVLSSTSIVTTSSISMTTYHAINFNTVTQYQVILDSGGTSALSSITSPKISGDNYWYDSGTPITLILNGVYGRSGGSGTRITGYSVNGGSNNPVSTTGTFTILNAIAISAPQTITTTTATQYQVTLDATSTSALNSITNPTISFDNYWYDSNTPVTVVLNGVWGQGSGTGTRLTGYVLNGGINNPVSTTGSVTVFSGSIANHEFVTATSVTQYQVTFTQTGVSSDAGSNMVLTLNSLPYVYNALPNNVWVDTGTSFSWASPVAGINGEQFVKTGGSGNSPIAAAATFSATYTTQYRVTFAVSPSGSGTTSPSGTNVWENAGSLPISVTANGGYYFSSWSATSGITIASPTSASTTANINAAGTITVAFTQLDHFIVTASGGGNIGTQTAGSAFSISITAKDASGNTIIGYAGTATLSDLSGAISPTSTGAFTTGVWTGSVTLTKTWTNDAITATGLGKSGTSNAFNIVAGGLSKFAVNAPASITAGTAFTLTVTAQDAYGNTVTSYSSSVGLSVSGTGSTINPTSASTTGWTAGVWTSSTVTVSAATGSGYTITANDGSSHTGASNTFNVIPLFIQPTITTKYAVASSTTLQYSVAQSNSYVVIVVMGGYYDLTSVTPPAGFTLQESQTVSNQYSAYISVNPAQASGTYTITCQGHPNTGISITVYVFTPGTYTVTHNHNSGTTSSASLTLPAGANYNIFGGSVGNGHITLSTATIDVQDSSNFSAIGHQTTQTATVTSSVSNDYVGIVGIGITRTG